MKFTAQGLSIQVNVSESWYDDETHVDMWTLRVYPHANSSTLLYEEIEHGGYPKDFELEDEASIVAYLSRKGVFGDGQKHAALEAERARLTEEWQQQLAAEDDARQRVQIYLHIIRHTEDQPLLEEYAEGFSKWWNASSTLGKLLQELGLVRAHNQSAAGTKRQLDMLDAELATLRSPHVQAITNLLVP